MGTYIATLTGELDGHTARKKFDTKADAIAWLQGDGLTSFDDQPARGDLHSSGGDLIWTKSHLQTKEQAEWDNGRTVRHILAKLGILDKYRKR
jgi:hypothetical protein